MNEQSNKNDEIKAMSIQAWRDPEVQAFRYPNNWHMNVVRLSALSSGYLYHPRKYSYYLFLLETGSTQRVRV